MDTADSTAGDLPATDDFVENEASERTKLVERTVPVTVTNPERSRQSFYRIVDPYLRFWFRFVLPAHDRLIDAGGAQRHLTELGVCDTG